jgi:2-polyprenyl-3-methyl-5-hydroxy-6-metoxy-1,4-benzoquinol methylase/GT2 family glycosyltransferase/ADP-heptose:LPS heptosyltransferase
MLNNDLKTADICNICGAKNSFSALGENVVLLREECCAVCGGSRRNSATAYGLLKAINSSCESLDEALCSGEFNTLKIFETGSSGVIHDRMASLSGYRASEYFDEIQPGQTFRGVRCEDLRRLTWTDELFDIVISEDVLEHVNDPVAALREVYRVLRPDGAFIFTVPVNEFGKTRQRRVDGIDLFPSVYHGDPVRSDGIKVVSEFGCDILDDLVDVGFTASLEVINTWYKAEEITDIATDEEYDKYLAKSGQPLEYFKYNNSVIVAFKEKGKHMEFTGERFVSDMQGAQISYEHWHRYMYATQFVSGKKVLDIACGEGYGSDYLSNFASEVVGVDISNEAVDFAKKKYTKSNVSFLQGSAAQIPVDGENVFDVIVSFETIEHISESDQANFLREAVRLLKPDGKLIISTPDKKNYSDIPNFRNEFHIKEFYQDEFKKFLKVGFENVYLLGQRISVGSHLWSLDEEHENLNVSKNYLISTNLNGGFCEAKKESGEIYFVAICSNVPVLFPSDSVLIDTDSTLFLEKDNELRRLSLERVELLSVLKERDERIALIESSNFGKIWKWYGKLKFIFFHPLRALLKISKLSGFYGFYKKRLKPFVPRPLFVVWNSIYNRTKWCIGIVQKYLALAKLAWNDYRSNGFFGLVFAVKRHFRKRRGELLTGYPVKNDYISGRVTIAILSKDGFDLIKPCIESIEKYRGEYDIEVLIGDTGTKDWRVKSFYRYAKKKFGNIRIVRIGRYFFSKNYNDLVRMYATGEFVVLLNNDTVATEGFLKALIEPLSDRRVGIVGAKLLNRDGTIQHAGIEFNEDGYGYHAYRNERSDIPEANIASVVPGVTFACVAMRHDVYDRFLLSEDFCEEAQDTDFCFRLTEAGFLVVYEPKAELFHFEGSSRDWQKGMPDGILLRERWNDRIRQLVTSRYQRVPFDADGYKDAIVLIRDDGIGDLLMGISAFDQLRKKHPNRTLILLTYERNIGMMAGFGIFDEILPIPNGKKYSPLPIPTHGTTVYDFIDLEMHFGNSFAETKENNKTHRHLVFTRDMGLNDVYTSVSMAEYPKAKERVLEIIRDAGADESSKFVVLNLIASNPARSWWELYYQELIVAIEEAGFTPLIVGTKDSEYFNGNRVVNLVGKTKNIEEYIEAVKLGSYVISTDTSACHVAGLANIPFLAIFTGGVLASARLGYYEKYEVLEPEGLSCFPCWDEGCKDLSIRHKKEPCRLMLTPDRVILKFKDLVQKYK